MRTANENSNTTQNKKQYSSNIAKQLQQQHCNNIIMKIASGRPDAYESTHISRILRQKYIQNVSNDVFHSEARM